MQGPSHSRPHPRRRATLACTGLALLVAGACGYTPAFEARWSVDRSARTDFLGEALAPLVRSEQCSRVGLKHVELLTYADRVDGRRLIAISDAPCFPGDFVDPQATFGGPELADGDYVIALRGVQNHPDRSPWIGTAPLPAECTGAGLHDPLRCQPCNAEGTACLPGFDACTCGRVTVRAADDTPVVEFVLPAPPECGDGIDNDADGRTDVHDEGCTVTPTCPPGVATCPASESTPAPRNALALDVRWLGVAESEVPRGTCMQLGVSELHLTVTQDEQPVWEGSVPCDARGPEDRLLALDLPPATYTIEVRTRDATGEERTAPRTLERSLVTGPNALVLEFWGDDFVEPLVGAATIALCEGTDPAITHARIEVLAPRGETASVVDTEGRPLDGGILPCETLVTEPLTFGLFAVEATLLAGDVECFATGDAKPRLWPGTTTAILAPEVLGGEGCPACLYDVHCGAGEVCLGSQCQPR